MQMTIMRSKVCTYAGAEAAKQPVGVRYIRASRQDHLACHGLVLQSALEGPSQHWRTMAEAYHKNLPAGMSNPGRRSLLCEPHHLPKTAICTLTAEGAP